MAALLSLHNKKSSFHEEEEKGGTSASLPWTPQLQHCLSVATCANRFGELIACPITLSTSPTTETACPGSQDPVAGHAILTSLYF